MIYLINCLNTSNNNFFNSKIIKTIYKFNMKFNNYLMDYIKGKT
jgi:hypothetical protein